MKKTHVFEVSDHPTQNRAVERLGISDLKRVEESYYICSGYRAALACAFVFAHANKQVVECYQGKTTDTSQSVRSFKTWHDSFQKRNNDDNRINRIYFTNCITRKFQVM